VSRFNAFYEGVIDTYYQQPERRAEFLVNPRFSRAIDSDASKTALPLSRLDCVLTEDGTLRVIEMNPIGVCTLYLQNARYLARAMEKLGHREDAGLLNQLTDEKLSSFRRFYEQHCPTPKERPTIAILTLPSWHRALRAMWREEFHRFGWNYVEGQVTDLAVSDTGITLRGRPIDVLWGDFLFHLGYQYVRYRETKFPSRVGNYQQSPDLTGIIMEDQRALNLFHTGRVVNLTPAKSYLALSKHLLSWIHRDYPTDERNRSWLADHVARTYSVEDRVQGRLSLDDVIRRKDEFLLKPCQYGGAHGVLIGRQSTVEVWRKRCEEAWHDTGWVIQDFFLPRRTTDGLWISVGIYNYGGRLGGITLRTASDLVISARTASFIPVVC
jgi:glutathionylspermidine synthase